MYKKFLGVGADYAFFILALCLGWKYIYLFFAVSKFLFSQIMRIAYNMLNP